MRPTIGITGAWSVETWGHSEEHGGYFYVGSYYSTAVSKSGGLPFIIPLPHKNAILKEFAKEIVSKLDAILFSGGGDAKKFKKEELPTLYKQQPLRYSFEKELLLEAWKRDLPILGICRGYQMLVEVFGGRLMDETIDGHKQNLPGYEPWHSLRIKENSKFENLVGTREMKVNSFHIQAVEKVPKGFEAVGWSDDGIIEAIEAIDKEFVFGVQFHPEERYDIDPHAKAIFDHFVEKAREYKKR